MSFAVPPKHCDQVILYGPGGIIGVSFCANSDVPLRAKRMIERVRSLFMAFDFDNVQIYQILSNRLSTAV